ncbi:MAG TPA: DUF4041 domain-containing protein [Terriglobales bacterium]|nr:DUF4041 domain-containing protein [Terriglobales bacterium]
MDTTTIGFAGAVAAAIIVALAVQVFLRARESARLRLDLEQLQEQLRATAAENAELARFRGILDTEAAARAILSDAQGERAKTSAEALRTLSEARERAKAARDEATRVVDAASANATKIIADANRRAEEIAGKAFDALKNADLYERAAQAMKNIVEGYGDQYIIPAHSMLDELADEFGYTDAGKSLKSARDMSRAMIRNGSAATCEYVEANRRTTAITFVIDAFNGKVDSILSRVKSDNAGTLAQEIRDAFTLVNMNGKAFREARITEVYLEARLEELKWAAIAQQLKLEEREEQRRIKEQLREEEKARREIERTLREAAKEEDVLRRAMEKAEQQIAKATDEQRSKYEQQLAELAERLRQAEEKNQRALSMAQQTKRGHVYVISNVGSLGEDVYKIGLTRRLEPLDRIRELGDSSVPFEFDVHAMIFADDAPALEHRLHNHFVLKQVNKVNHRKEFFRADLAEIRAEIEQLGLNTHWTMAAAAKEYKETLAIEKRIQEDPAAREAWVRRQFQLESLEPLLDAISEELQAEV